MKFSISKQLPSAVLKIEVESGDVKEAMAQLLPFGQPDKCDLCGCTAIKWDTNKAISKDDGAAYMYVKRICTGCTASSTLGTYSGIKGYFWHKWEIYKSPAPNYTGEGAVPVAPVAPAPVAPQPAQVPVPADFMEKPDVIPF